MKRILFVVALLGAAGSVGSHVNRATAEQQHLKWENLVNFPPCVYPCHTSNPQGEKCTCAVN